MKDKQKNSTSFGDEDFFNSEITISDLIMVSSCIFIHLSFLKSLKSDKNKFLKFLEETRKVKK
jgi:hypothetical protein